MYTTLVSGPNSRKATCSEYILLSFPSDNQINDKIWYVNVYKRKVSNIYMSPDIAVSCCLSYIHVIHITHILTSSTYNTLYQEYDGVLHYHEHHLVLLPERAYCQNVIQYQIPCNQKDNWQTIQHFNEISSATRLSRHKMRNIDFAVAQ